ncbi:hypothetical protein MAH4_00680 [Sessilibacter sp. MAH4]
MHKMRLKNTSAAILSLMTYLTVSAPSHAISFSEGGWNVDISGSVGGYYTQTNCNFKPDSAQWSTFSACKFAVNNDDTASVQNGFLPGWLNTIVTHTTDSGMKLTAHFGFAPGTSNPSSFGGRIAGAQNVGDVRNVYLKVEDDWGSVLLGRDAALFGLHATLSDITVPGVGTQAEAAGALNTTFGAVAAGYTYFSFQPQITYATPVVNGFQAKFGVIQPVDIQPDPINTGGPIYNVHDTPMFQGLLTYDFAGGSKLWTSFVQQDARRSDTDEEISAEGFEIGGRLVLGKFTANASTFIGDALGDGILFVGATDSEGNEYETEGYLLNAGYQFGKTRLSVQYGVTENKDLAGAENEVSSIVLVRDITPGLQFIAEYTQHTTSQDGFSDAEASTVAAGALLSF